MADRIQVRRDTDADWQSNDPTLAAGELGFVSDTDELVVGDGATAYSSLTRRFPGGLRQVVTFTSSGTFTKGDYPWLRHVRVFVHAGGGGGGGALASSGSELAPASGGSGGACSVKLVAVGSLGTTTTVTVGAGGTGGSGNADGSAGGTSSFGTQADASGGAGGAQPANSGTTVLTMAGTDPQAAGTGADYKLPGSSGEGGVRLSATQGYGGKGGDSFFGVGGARVVGAGGSGQDAELYGGGGGGACDRGGTSKSGGDGADGIVIVELYA